MRPVDERRCFSRKAWRRTAALTLAFAAATSATVRGENAAAPDAVMPVIITPDHFQAVYAGYGPGYLDFLAGTKKGQASIGYHWGQAASILPTSFEKAFTTFNQVEEDSGAYALVVAARKCEAGGESREAMKIYQQALERFPRAMYRVDRHGVFIPISRYCQLRILALPPADLAFYRTLYDPRAKEAFDQANRQYSLIGFQEIVDSMLATTYGASALSTLGHTALDNGHFVEALERFQLLKQFFRQSKDASVDLDLKIAYCRKALGLATPGDEARAAGLTGTAAAFQALVRQQKAASGGAGSADDDRASSSNLSALQPDVKDPMAVSEPIWTETLAGSYKDFAVFTQPVVSRDSVLYLHKNIVYSRSLLNGQLRWTFDIGGRLTRQVSSEQLFPQDELLVHDGMVYANVIKSGPSLVALDFISGQLKWMAGPTAPVSKQDTHIRYEAAPVGGQRTVYAGYVLDNIEGDTHFDTVYGVKAFDSESGQELWNQPLCRLAPGKFSAGTTEERRIRIRSFSSPPVLHQGTLYYNTNAGAIAALDARSGEIKWLIRYPYWPTIHDSTVRFLTAPLWYNQRPIVTGDNLCVAPVDSPMLFCIERGTGKVTWSYMKGVDFSGHAGHKYLRSAYVLGPTAGGELVVTYGCREAPLHLLDVKSGKLLWQAEDLIKPETAPVMTATKKELAGDGLPISTLSVQLSEFVVGARPLLTESGRLYLCSYEFVLAGENAQIPGYVCNLAAVDLPERRVAGQRRYYDSMIQSMAQWLIDDYAPKRIKAPDAAPYKENLAKVINDKVPKNDEAPFLPMVRLSFSRYGVPFELRMDARTVSMCYDRAAVAEALAKRKDAPAIFARAEQALYDTDFAMASALLKECTQAASSQDLDLRMRVNQLCYQVNLTMAQQAIRDGKPAEELAACLDLARTAGDLAGEVRALLALSEAYQRLNDTPAAVRCLRSIVRYYGNKPYASAVLALNHVEHTMANAGIALDRSINHFHGEFYVREFNRVAALQRAAIPSYAAAVSPLPRMVSVEAGPLAVGRLLTLQKRDPAFAADYEQQAAAELGAAAPDHLIRMVMEFPGTRAAQSALERLSNAPAAETGHWSARKYLWELSYLAEICGLTLNEKSRGKLGISPAPKQAAPLPDAIAERKVQFNDAEIIRMVLERRDDGALHQDLLFVGGRARKRNVGQDPNNKFELSCFNVRTGEKKWTTPSLRLKGTGQEPGFSEAFIRGDMVVVHGLYDVLAFGANDGAPKWNYRVPFNFEIVHATLAGDLLILSGSAQTIALYMPTDAPTGEVAWECQESGDLYRAPYMVNDRIILTRKNTDCVTARQVGTGRLIASLEVPGLSRCVKHPLLEEGPPSLPAAHCGNFLIVTDNSYYIAIDVLKMAVIWKRPIDGNDETRDAVMRLTMSETCCVVLKRDFDAVALHGLNPANGALLWRTDAKVPTSPKALHSVVVSDKVVGILPGAGRGFHVVTLDPLTGKQLFATEFSECQSEPVVDLWPSVFGNHVVVRLQDNQKFTCAAVNISTGKLGATLTTEGVGPFGSIGRVSATVQSGALALFSQSQNVMILGTK